MTWVIAACVAVIAAVVQRVTGLGFALVATPPMVLLFGAVDGVLVVVLLGVVASGIMAITMRDDIEWRRAVQLIWPAVLVSPLAALVVWVSSPRVLLLAVGLAALLSLVAPKIPGFAKVFTTGRASEVVTGGAAGFLHVTSGLSGPPLVAYASGQKWDQRGFVATVQAIFVAYYLLTLAWRGLPASGSALVLAGLVGLVVVGVIVGGWLARRISALHARRAMFTIAWIGAISVTVRAVLEFLPTA